MRLLQALRLVGEADRAQLARMTGLSRATVSGLLGEAIARGHVVESRPEGAAPAGRGGRPAVLRLDPRAGMVVGVDLGHSHVRVVLADLSATVLSERRVALDVDAAADVTLDTAAGLVDDAVRSAGVDPRRLLGVAMGVPGPVDRQTGMVRSASILAGWVGVRPGEELSRRLGLPVCVENDANLGVLGEHFHGAARGTGDVVYVKVSSGVGAGLMLGGSLYAGSRGVAGEIGHVTVVPNGHICRCGNRGCLETVASAGALARALAPTHGDARTLRELLDLIDGDPLVERELRDVGRHVGRALAPLCMALDVELVVVGGELGAVSRDLVRAVRTELRRTVVSRRPVRVRPALLGDQAEALGAVALALGQEVWLRQAGLIALNGGDEMARLRSSSERHVATG